MSEQSGSGQKRSPWQFFVNAFAVLALAVIVMAILLPAGGSREASPRTQCKNNLKQIVLALHNYHDAYGCFPPAYIADKQGRPMHSWRVLILPFVEFKPIYQQYRFDEPWNGPHNRELTSLNLNLFHCPAEKSSDTDGETNYLVVVGPKTVFPGEKCVRISEIAAGTILLVEVDNSGIKWGEPRDLSFIEAVRGINPKLGLGISSRHEGGAQCAFANGSVRFLPNNTPPGHLRSFLELDGVKPRLPAN
jgi:hypothetical protein